MMKKAFWWCVRLGLGVLLVIVVCHLWIVKSTEHQHHAEPTSIPAHKTALVLGTVPTLKNGTSNWYFEYRMEMAANLYKSGRVKQFVLSGDNHVEGYDEPEAMRLALMALGVPDSVLFLDYAGFRTLDSVVRLKAIFGQDSAIVISQKFHNERAIAIGRRHDIHLFGANAQDVNASFGIKTRLREYLARVKCVLDLYVLQTEPKFLGERVELPM